LNDAPFQRNCTFHPVAVGGAPDIVMAHVLMAAATLSVAVGADTMALVSLSAGQANPPFAGWIVTVRVRCSVVALIAVHADQSDT